MNKQVIWADWPINKAYITGRLTNDDDNSTTTTGKHMNFIMIFVIT